MFQVNNKDTFLGVSIVNFGQMYAGWVDVITTGDKSLVCTCIYADEKHLPVHYH